MRNSLFLKVYLTLLASLAVVALASGLFIRMVQDDETAGWRDRRERFLAEILPPAWQPELLQFAVDKLARAVDGDVAVYDDDGTLLTGAGKPFPRDVLSSNRLRRQADGSRIFVIDLPDGRHVAGRVPGGPAGRNPLAFLAFIAIAIGIASYPVVRHLTRRLEQLRQGVEAWGSGKLVTRVSIGGKDEVAAVAKSFNRAADHVEELLSAHQSLLANASHELRSPLARLRMAIDLYEQEPRETIKREIVRNLAELDSLVEEILLASRLDHLAQPVAMEPIDLLALAAEEGARNGIAVTGESVTIRGDSRLLLRLVRNLMQNALRHGAPPISACVERDDAGVRLSVRDHGAGLPKAESTRIFEPFYRPPGRSETAGGWGLGLSLVRQIAKRHGGEAGYETAPDGGACFFVLLPTGDGLPETS